MRFLNACTYELDEPAIAVSEILKQLDLDKNALTHSVGFLTCSYDFVEAGIVKVICDALPFDVVGSTTLSNAADNAAGTMLLCLTVLTADDCQFAAARIGPSREDAEAAIQAGIREAKTGLHEEAKMALVFMPPYALGGGEIMLEALDKALQGTPIFGLVACDFDVLEFKNTYVLHNGEHYKDYLVFLLISGNVNPRFIVASTSEQNLRKQEAVITESEGNILKSINNMSARAYLESVGLASGKAVEGIGSIPFVVDRNDGTQRICRVITSLNDDGHAICGGYMPEGGTLYIGRMDVDDILLSVEDSLKALLADGTPGGIIMFPCMSRNFVLATDHMAEINIAKECLTGIPWHFAYAGGECCPVATQDGGLVSRFHNFTFIACAL